MWSKYPLRKVISALAFQHLHSLPLYRPNTSSINCLLSDITRRHTYMHVRSQSYSNCCIFTEVAISPLIACDIIKHLYLFPVSIFSNWKKKDLRMAVSKYHYMHYYKHLSTSGYFFKSLPLIKFHFLCSIAADLLVNPCEEILHPGVHTVLAFISASNTPACDTMKTVQPRSILAHHWSAAISLAWIHSPFRQSCTNHWLMNTVLLISLFACTLTYHGNGSYLQLVWLISTRRQCTPTCDNTRISNNCISRW